LWAMENLVEGVVVNRIKVDEETARWAKVALNRMLAIQ
jgi:quinolinate synthase